MNSSFASPTAFGRRGLWQLLAAVGLTALAAVEAAGQEAAEAELDGHAWIERMNRAVRELNYRGTYVNDGDSQIEILDIVHRNAGGIVSERISARDGGSEVFRTDKQMRRVFPDEERVILLEPGEESAWIPPLTNISDELETYYELATFPSQRGKIAGRSAQVVILRAKDKFRYSHYLWLDRDTALPLRYQLVDRRLEGGERKDVVVEQILFTDLEVVDSIAESEVAPVIDTEGYSEERPRRTLTTDPVGGEQWAANLPDGFRESVDGHVLFADSEYPVRHLVYTDGLATVSVYISHPKSKASGEEGPSRRGGASAYWLKIDGRLAVAMGEVPLRTVQRIATTLNAR